MFTFQKRIGRGLGTLRRQGGVQQKDLAKDLEVSARWLSTVETGQGQPSVEVVDRFLDLTRTDGYRLVDAMYGESGNPDEVAAEILDLLRLGPLTPESRREALFEIHRLGFALQLMGSDGDDESETDSSAGD